MSLKPLKVSDLKKREEKFKKKQKEELSLLPPYTLIVTEGTKTEVHYFSKFADRINTKFAKQTKRKIIDVFGCGKSCLDLLHKTRKTVDHLMPWASTVWLVYDKDSFEKDDFDNAENSALHRRDFRTYKTAWSNECFELWFLLHFQDLRVNVGREKYLEILNQYCHYKKNSPDMYELLKEKLPSAIERADALYHSYPKGCAPSKMCPATKVHFLVKELLEYL